MTALVALVVALLLLWLALWTVVARDAFVAVAGFVVYGLLLSLVWVRLAGIDVALTEAAIGGGLTGALLLGTVGRLRGNVILGKLEGNNPAGSVKDRPAISMIRGAEERGEISPGDTLLRAALELGLDVAEMACVVAPDHTWDRPLVIGDRLSVPPPAVICHTTQPGDTADTIAAQYADRGITADAIVEVLARLSGSKAVELSEEQKRSYLATPALVGRARELQVLRDAEGRARDAEVEGGKAGHDRAGVDGDVHGPGLGLLVQHHRARGLIELADLRGEA